MLRNTKCAYRFIKSGENHPCQLAISWLSLSCCKGREKKIPILHVKLWWSPSTVPKPANLPAVFCWLVQRREKPEHRGRKVLGLLCRRAFLSSFAFLSNSQSLLHRWNWDKNTSEWLEKQAPCLQLFCVPSLDAATIM